jgi:hypothetical protein
MNNPIIASATKGGCVLHGLSVMRSALGYDGPLPSTVSGTRTQSEIIEMLPQWFVRHPVYVWCNEEIWEGVVSHPILTNIQYRGGVGEIVNDKDIDAMWAFAYHQDGRDNGHFVVGLPVTYGDMRCCLAIAVLLEQNVHTAS